jgi:hypothetical protein
VRTRANDERDGDRWERRHRRRTARDIIIVIVAE